MITQIALAKIKLAIDQKDDPILFNYAHKQAIIGLVNTIDLMEEALIQIRIGEIRLWEEYVNEEYWQRMPHLDEP